LLISETAKSGFSFPEWFRSKYSEAFQNVKLNADRLTCPFELHPTFLDILDFTGAGIGNIKNRGIRFVSLHCENRRQILRHHRTLYIPL
jgi:hypothetical protein